MTPRPIRILVAMVLSIGLSSCAVVERQNQEKDIDPLISYANQYQESVLESSQPVAYFADMPLERHNKFFDNTPEGLVKNHRLVDELLASLKDLDVSREDEKRHVFYVKFIEALESSQARRVCKGQLWGINHLFNVTNWLDRLVSLQPLETEAERADALERWGLISDYIQQEIQNLNTGLEQGYSSPQRVIKRVIKQLKALTEIEIDEHPYMKLAERSKDAEFNKQFKLLLETELLPAIVDFNSYLQTNYLPKARTELSLSALPNGRACYMASYRNYTTLNRTPEEVYALGLDTVNKNKARVIELGKTAYGLADFELIIKKARDDENEKFSNADQMHEFYVAVIERAKLAMPEYFYQMPSIPLVVEPIPEYRQETGVGPHYVRGTKTRSAKFGYDPTQYASEPFGSAEIVSVHEGFPGHHMQIALAYDRKVFHPIEIWFSNSAYAEGWGRYSEQLAEEAGLYRTQSAKILRRAWPARGMVGDTGLHMFGWSNAKTAEFLKESGASFTADIDILLDRMSVWPAQLTAYDSGALEIMALRKYMQDSLGDDFDIKKFHQIVLKNGIVPLELLREQVTIETDK